MEPKQEPKQEPEPKHSIQAGVQLFQAVATFSFLVVVVLCIGVPLVLGYLPWPSDKLRCCCVTIAGGASILVVLSVMAAYALAIWRSPSRK
jgi:hypothetical protein